MNYERIYAEFIADRRLKERSLVGYTEKHHIIPRSFGGDDDAKNLIRLTPGDHYFAHECLARIHGGKMWAALYFMSHNGTTSANGAIVTRRKYETARKNYLQNLPDHVIEMGARLAKNESRVRALKAYHATVDLSSIIKERFNDPEFFARWIESQKDAWTDSRREALSELMKKRWADEEYRSKASKNMKANSGSFVAGQKAHNAKPVINLTTGETYKSAADAGKSIGHANGNKVALCCNGKAKTAGGYTWAHADKMKAAA